MKNKEYFINKFILFFRFFSAIIISICILFILNWKKHNDHNKQIQNNLVNSTFISNSISNPASNSIVNINNTTSNTDNIDFSHLLEINPNTVGWIKVNETNIDYSVVKYTDNSFYLNHSFDDTYNSAGWIFADYRNKFDNSDKNIIIYGHNRKNKSMFSTLENILDPNWYLNKDNHFITLYTSEKKLKYQVFSAYQTSIKDFDVKLSFASNNEFNSYIKYLAEQSIYNFNATLSSDDKILTLSTCADNNYYRIVLHAKLIN